MTFEELDILEQILKKANKIKKLLEVCPGDDPDYVKLCLEFDQLDALSFIAPKIKRSHIEKVLDIRKFVLQQSKGHVILSDETINGIINKAVI